MYTTGICGLDSLPSCERQLHCLCFSIKTGHSFEEDRRLIEKFRGSKLLNVCGKCVTTPSLPPRADINMAMPEAKEPRSKSDHVEMVPCQEIPHSSRQWLKLLTAFSLLGSFVGICIFCFIFCVFILMVLRFSCKKLDNHTSRRAVPRVLLPVRLLRGSMVGQPERPTAGPLWALLSLVKDSFKSCEVTCR